MTPLTAATHNRIYKLFTAEDRPAAASALEHRCAENLPGQRGRTPESLERIRFAVLKLSNGDILKLNHWIDQAQLDWRDVLIAAGFGSDIHAHQSWLAD